MFRYWEFGQMTGQFPTPSLRKEIVMSKPFAPLGIQNPETKGIIERIARERREKEAFMTPALEEMKKRRDDLLRSCVAFQTILFIQLQDKSRLACLYVSHNSQSVVVSRDGAMRRIPFLAMEGLEKP